VGALRRLAVPSGPWAGGAGLGGFPAAVKSGPACSVPVATLSCHWHEAGTAAGRKVTLRVDAPTPRLRPAESVNALNLPPPHVGLREPWERLPAALEALQGGGTLGKVVVQLSPAARGDSGAGAAVAE
jgi:hypothetical protein